MDLFPLPSKYQPSLGHGQKATHKMIGVSCLSGKCFGSVVQMARWTLLHLNQGTRTECHFSQFSSCKVFWILQCPHIIPIPSYKSFQCSWKNFFKSIWLANAIKRAIRLSVNICLLSNMVLLVALSFNSCWNAF